MATYTFQNGDGPYQLFPTSIEPESFEIRHPRRTLVADSRSMRRQSRSIGGVRIEATFKFPPMHKDEYGTFRCVLSTHRWSAYSFRYALAVCSRRQQLHDNCLKIGEYYNRNSSTLNNQLMQYVGLSGVTLSPIPPARDTGYCVVKPTESTFPL
jgi:hypothetical protein